MGKEMTKMPDGSFAVDEEKLIIERAAKAPYTPTIKLKEGGSAELPSEVTNAIETGGMGWTDEDETVHQIDEKYISKGFIIEGSIQVNNEDGTYEVSITTPVSDIINHKDNITGVVLTENNFYKWVLDISGKVDYGGGLYLFFGSYSYNRTDTGSSYLLRALSLIITDGEIFDCKYNVFEASSGSKYKVRFSISDGTISSARSVSDVKNAMKNEYIVVGTLLDDYGEDYIGLGACVLFNGEPAFDYLGSDKFRITAENGQWVLNSAD